MNEFNVGDLVEIVYRGWGPLKVGHVGTVKAVRKICNLCVNVDNAWNYPIDTKQVYVRLVAPANLENE